MARNLDLTAIRSFVTVAESGGVTRAAGFLNLTQSAVSMQLKRLEESLGQTLLDRSNRSIGLTAQGEQLLAYGRKLLQINDEALARLTDQAFEGEVVFGVPADIVYPHVPEVLKRFAREYPRVKVQLQSSYTARLKQHFNDGEADVILTTEETGSPGAEHLQSLPLTWFGAPGGVAWRTRPLRLAYQNQCIFRKPVQAALAEAGILWEMAVDTSSTRTVEASLSADLAIHASLKGTCPPYLEEIAHGGGLPALPEFQINMYCAPEAQSPLAARLADVVRATFRA